MKKKLQKLILLAAALLAGGNAWADTQTIGASNATTAKDTHVIGTAVNIHSSSNPSGTGSYAVFNTSTDKGIKLRTGSPLTLVVNSGYKVTNVTISAYQNNESNAVMTCDSYTVDGGSAISFDPAKDIPLNVKNATNQTFAAINTGEIEAASSIVFNFTNPSGKNSQIFAYIEVTYDVVQNTIYSKTLDEWSSSDITQTEGTVGKWYNSYGMATADYYNGMYIESTYGLHVGARDNSNKVPATLALNHTANSIITLDAVWNIGYKSSDANTPYSQFSYGDFTLTQVLDTRSDKHKTTYTINGTTEDLGVVITDNNVDVDVHLVVNSYTGAITEFYLKNGETYLAQFSDLTPTNNHFAENANYDAVTMSVYMQGSKANAWTSLKSINISEQEQDIYSYTVNGKAGSTILKEIATGTNFPGSIISYYYNNVLNVNGTLYEAASENSGYKSSFNLNSDNQEVVKSYSQPSTPITNLVFLAEGEDLFTKGTGSSADTRCSMGAGGYAGSKTAFVTLPAGTYNLVLSNRCSGNRTGIHKFYKGDDAEPFFSADGNGYNDVRKSGEFILGATTTLYMQGGDNNQYVDWIYIYGTPSATPVTVYKAVGGMTTFASDDALDFTDTDVKAYIASGTEDESGTTVVSLKKVEAIPAGTPVLVYYPEDMGEDASKTFDVPVVASADEITETNLFVRGTGATVATDDNGYKNYVLTTSGSDYGFYWANDRTVGTNKAYLHVQTSNPIKLRFDDSNEIATGIINVENENMLFDGATYNLAGQRVSDGYKGIVIRNGKKYLVK